MQGGRRQSRKVVMFVRVKVPALPHGRHGRRFVCVFSADNPCTSHEEITTGRNGSIELNRQTTRI